MTSHVRSPLWTLYELAIVCPIFLHCDLVKKKVSTSVNLVKSFSPAVFKNQIFFLLKQNIFIGCAEKKIEICSTITNCQKLSGFFLKMNGFKNIGLGNNF